MLKIGIFSLLFWLQGLMNIAQATDCRSELSRQSTLLPSITLNDFDRKAESGWRVLADAGCFEEARKIIEQYIEKNGPQSSLFLHLGQLELRMEKRADAEAHFKRAVRDTEEIDAPFKFNDFSLALAAYAASDLAQFNKHYDIVEQNKGNMGNRMNLKLLNAIRDHFNRPYLEILAVLR